MKKTFEEFKAFIAQGNVIDMAVGVVMGSAFTAIVNSVVTDLITPLIGMLMGGIDFSGLVLTVGDAKFTYGNLINAIINFLLVALCLFFIMKALVKLKVKKPEEEPAPAEPSDEVKLLTQIVEELKKSNGEAAEEVKAADKK